MAEKKIKVKKNKANKAQIEMVIDNERYVKTPAYWESTLFSEVYLNNDLKRDFSEKWERDHDDVIFDENGDSVKSGFAHFYNEFRNIAPALRNLTNRKLSETDTITKIIAPMLDVLGWYNNCQNNVEEPYAAETSFTVKGKGEEKGKVYRTDILLVDHPQEASYIADPKNSNKRKKEARQHCLAPLEAKYWNCITDKEGNKKLDKAREDKKSDDSGASLSFNEQALNYMDILHKKWGIVTDGNTWRLVHHEISGEAPERCFEFKLESLLSKEKRIGDKGQDDDEFIENAKYFYLFFGKPSYVKDDIGKYFLDEVLKESRKYIDTIEEDLKDRFISAMNYTCNGLLCAAKEKGTIKTPNEDDLKLIRTVAESHLFNILFIKSCEARGVLPMKAPQYIEISLSNIINRLRPFDPEKYTTSGDKNYINAQLLKSLKGLKFKPESTNLYQNLMKLTEVIHDGAGKLNYGFEIKGFKESIFSKEEWSFAKKHKLTDEEMVQIIFQLGYSKSEQALQRNYQQVPYNYFTARQLGSIYESFLEYQLDIAKEPMVYIKKGKYKQWVKLTSSTQKKLKGFEPIVKKGQLFFTPDNSERKTTGSYYTPDYIVKYIVQETIGPLCKNKFSKEILDLKICDPAMGSGHFLIGALNFITRKYLSALETENMETELPTLSEAKRIVLDKCIFGVDINSRAVKLAKMSLWLESAHSGKKLERLDDQLMTGNSLAREKFSNHKKFCFKNIFNLKQGFDAVIMNPPYISSFKTDEKKYFFHNYVCRDRELDTFSLFFERGIELLNYNGRLGAITPSSYLLQVSFKSLRTFILNNTFVDQIIDLGNDIFEEACVPSCTTILQKEPTEITFIQSKSDFIRNGMNAITKIERSVFQNNKNKNFITNVINHNFISQLNLEKFERISEYLSIHEGIHSGNIRHKLFFDSLDKNNPTFKKYLKGRDFDENLISWNGRWVSYDKKIIDKSKKEYASLRDEKIFLEPKIISRQTADTIIANTDLRDAYYTDNSVHCSILKKPYIGLDKTKSLIILTILMNSRLVKKWYSVITSESGRVFPQVKIIILKEIPIPKKIDKKYIDKLILFYKKNKFKEINLIVDKIYEIDSS